MKKTVLIGMSFLSISLGLQSAANADVELPSQIEERGHVIVGTYCDYAPFGFIGDQQKPEGVEVDLAKKLAEYAFGDENSIEIQCVKSADRIPFLQTRKVDFLISALGITPTRARAIDFTKPYFASTTVFLAKTGEEFESFEDLHGKTLLLSSGTPWITWLQGCQPNVEIGQYDSITNQLAALSAGRGVALLNDSTLLYPVAARNDSYIITGPNVKEQGYAWGFGVRKGNTEVLDWLNDQIDRMQEEDVFWEIVQRWEDNENILKELEAVVRRPGQTPDYAAYEASQTDDPSCP